MGKGNLPLGQTLKAWVALTLVLSLVIPTLSFAMASYSGAGEHNHNNDTLPETAAIPGVSGALCEDIVHVEVAGMNCDFCARSLTNYFGSRDEVAGVTVDLSSGQISIATKTGVTIDGKVVKKVIVEHGYFVKAIKKGC